MTDSEDAPDFGGDRIIFELREERNLGQATLECPACGFVFEVDAYTNENLWWDAKQKAWCACCPICQRKEK